MKMMAVMVFDDVRSSDQRTLRKLISAEIFNCIQNLAHKTIAVQKNTTLKIFK